VAIVLTKTKTFLFAEDAATAVEYAVMLALIMVACISAIATLGSQTSALWGTIDSDAQNAGFGS